MAGLILGGACPEARAARAVFPESIWPYAQPNQFLALHGSQLFRLPATWEAFYQFLKTIVPETTTTTFETLSLFSATHTEIFIKALDRMAGVRVYRCAVPNSLTAFDTDAFFPLTSGAGVLSFTPALRARLLMLTPEYALKSLQALCPEAQSERDPVTTDVYLMLPHLAKYRLTFDYSL